MIAGRVRAERVILTDGEQEVLAERSAATQDGMLDFSLGLAAPQAEVALAVHADGKSHGQRLATPGLFARARHRARLVAGFARLIYAVLPELLRWIRHRDPEARRRLGARIRSATVEPGTLDVARLRAAPVAQGAGPVAQDATPITIILPVYNGHDLLVDVLRRVEEHTDLPWHLVIIDDASSDPRIGPLLLSWRARLGPERVEFLQNSSNLGFIRSVNRGLERARRRQEHAVLLNSDALVPKGWASRLLGPIIADSTVASVTPMSNDAEICNVPFMGRRFHLRPGEAERLDAVAQGLGNAEAPAEAGAEAPTGVGFCMAMNLDFLRQLPELDTAFGAGYGEEVDWCQRAAAIGGRNLITPALFVEHIGGSSFGSETKARLIRQNGKIISGRYPGYDAAVQGFLRNDPLLTQRLALSIALASDRAQASGRSLALFLTHSLGGGAAIYLQQRLRRELDATGFALVLRCGQTPAWRLELHGHQGVVMALADAEPAIAEILRFARCLHVVYSCGVGAKDPLAIPDLLLALASAEGSSVEMTFNDYLPLSPTYTLLDKDGVFRGVPMPGTADAGHDHVTESGRSVGLAEWREAWGRLMARADIIRVFSQNSKRLVGHAWPEHAARIKVTPHDLPHAVPRLAAPPHIGRLRSIGVLGNINGPKGAGILVGLSRELARRGDARIVLLGNLEPGFRLARPSFVAGPYQLPKMAALAGKYRIERWLFPSILPETFSYVTHEMLATGLPVFGFPLGAQGDALARAIAAGAGGGLLPFEEGRHDFRLLAERILTDRTSDSPPTSCPRERELQS